MVGILALRGAYRAAGAQGMQQGVYLGECVPARGFYRRERRLGLLGFAIEQFQADRGLHIWLVRRRDPA